MKGYYSDKTHNPWDKIYKEIQKISSKQENERDLEELLILLREAVFGAFDILSFGLITEISTTDVIQTFTTEKDWNLGRRQVRNLCLDIVDELIEKGEIRYLLSSSLKREGFGFLTNRIEEIELEQFRKAKPKISRGKLNLSKLEDSVIGSRFLRDQSVMDVMIDKDDPLVESIQEAYELQLVELEFERSTMTKTPQETEQITLNGYPVEATSEEKTTTSKKKRSTEVQKPLSEFITNKEQSSKKGSMSKRRKKK